MCHVLAGLSSKMKPRMNPNLMAGLSTVMLAWAVIRLVTPRIHAIACRHQRLQPARHGETYRTQRSDDLDIRRARSWSAVPLESGSRRRIVSTGLKFRYP